MSNIDDIVVDFTDHTPRPFGTRYSPMNEVVSPHMAVLNGQMTGLAGCSNHACEARELCLRGSDRLAFRIMPKRHLKTGFDCPYFVPVDDTPTNLTGFSVSDRVRWRRQLTWS